MKVELRKELKSLYSASAKKPGFVTVPALQYLMIDGEGAPDGNPAFQDAIGALYGGVYTLKFMLKKAEPPLDFDIMPLEGVWWCEGTECFVRDRPELWRWTLMITVPSSVTRAMLRRAVDLLAEKRGRTPAMGKLRLAKSREGKSVQMMHIGRYSEEAPTLEAMRHFTEQQGYSWAGRHHEIYFSDPRRTPPEKLRTLLRMPVKTARRTTTAAA